MKLKVNVDEILTEERLALLPDLTKQEKKALAWCIVYTGMESEDGSFKKKCAGHFYRSNKYFMNDVGMAKTSFMRCIEGLMSKGLLKRRRGSYEKRRLEGVGASEYIIPDELTEWHPLKNLSEDFTGFSLSDLKIKTKVDPDNIDNKIIDKADKADNNEKLDKRETDKLINGKTDNNEKLDNETIDKQNKLEKAYKADNSEKLDNGEADNKEKEDFIRMLEDRGNYICVDQKDSLWEKYSVSYKYGLKSFLEDMHL